MGGPAAAGVAQHSALERAYCRARREGSLTPFAADRLAIRLLGLHPVLVWGDEWWTEMVS